METTTLTFSKGMSTDVDKTFRQQDSYIRAENFSASPIDEGTVLALSNTKSNEIDSTITFANGHSVVGYANVVRNTVYFTTDGSVSNIYYHEEGVGTTLKYSDTSSNTKLNFSLDPKNRIVAVGRQELLDLEKVYWVDGINELRYIDLSKDYTGSESTAFNVVPPNDITATIDTTPVIGSGLYTSGTVYHSYQFYTLNGAASTISSTSNPVRLSQFTGNKDGGNEKDEDANCSVRIRIGDIDQSVLDIYNRIRIYSIHYTDTELPVINIVAERNLISDSITVIDTGNTLGTIELDSYLSYNQTSYIPEAIASKNNNLFIGNLKEDTFSSPAIDNWDARAYRFDSGATKARLYTADEATYIDVDNINFQALGTSTHPGINIGDDVPGDFDCHNRYNNIFTNSLANRRANYNYKYKSDGTTIGGEGVNISYSFNTSLTKIFDTADSVSQIRSREVVKHNQEDIYTGGGGETFLLECMDGEVYRVGIKFINSKGQSSFVKWIGDILWEETYDDVGVGNKTIGTLNGFSTRAVTLAVTIKNFPADPDIVAYQIVRAERGITDSTVVSNGILQHTLDEPNDSESFNRPSITNTIENYVALGVPQTLFKFISPETMFNNPDDSRLDGYRIRVYNYINQTDNDLDQTRNFGSGGIFLAGVRKMNSIRTLDTPSDVHEDQLYNISDYRYVLPQHSQDGVTDVTVPIAGVNYLNQSFAGITTPIVLNYTAGACSSFMIELGSTLGNVVTTPANTSSYFMGSLMKDVDKTRYGGIAYQDIINTTFIPFSRVTPVATVDALCIYGDTNTNSYLYFQDLFVDSSGLRTRGRQNLVAFPIQSTIDLRRRSDRILDFYTGLDDLETTASEASDLMFIQETVEEGIQFQGLVYDTRIGDLYRYNPAYSVEPKFEVSFPKPFDFIEDKHSTTKVLASEKKVNGEAEDQWTNFLPSNFIETDSAYGGINTLYTKDNSLFFWQDRAFGALASNDRSLISDSAGAQLSLGTGGVLERYDYYSTEVGNIDKYNVNSTENGLFWVYSPKNNIYLFDNQIKEISTSEGLKSYMVNKGDIVNPITSVDSVNNEVLFKLNDEVLSYDTTLGKFISVYTYVPEWFIKDFDGNYKSSPDGQVFYQHNSNTLPRATYYGTTYDSKLKHMCNDKAGITKVFDTIDWHSTSIDSTGPNLFADTFDRIRVYNDYQNSDWKDIDISSKNMRRSERSFRTHVPRDIVNSPQKDNVDIFNPSNLDPTLTYKRRMRDKYIILDLEYDNSNGNKFSIPYININYRQSIR